MLQEWESCARLLGSILRHDAAAMGSVDGQDEQRRLLACLDDGDYSVELYCNFTSLAFLGLLGFLTRQLKT